MMTHWMIPRRRNAPLARWPLATANGGLEQLMEDVWRGFGGTPQAPARWPRVATLADLSALIKNERGEGKIYSTH